MLHDDPREIAVIGLGSGDTLYALAGREETKEILCVEIVRAELESLQLLQLRNPYPALNALFTDSRIKFLFGDGRTHLGLSTKKYDIIEADALRPGSAFAGNLYSYEYFQMLKTRLKPGGFAVSWGPTKRVVQTFLSVFPHVLNFDSILIGSAEPIEFDREEIRRRTEHPFSRAHYGRMELDFAGVVLPFFDRPMASVKLDHAQFNLADINTDLHPKDEYAR
jgi:spermidine synthase